MSLRCGRCDAQGTLRASTRSVTKPVALPKAFVGIQFFFGFSQLELPDTKNTGFLSHVFFFEPKMVAASSWVMINP